MGTAVASRKNGAQPRDRGVVKARMAWEETTPFPDNPIYEGRLVQMAKRGDYNHRIVGAPAIFLNDGGAFPDYPPETRFVGDGNHRRELARRHRALGAEIVAELYSGLTAAQMYEMREGLNDRRTVKPAETFLSRAARNSLGIERIIKDAVEGTGWRVTHEREDKGLPYVKELQWIWEQDKAAMILAIRTYEACFGVKGESGQGMVLKGMGAFWIRHPDADADRLVKAVRGIKKDGTTKQRIKALYGSGKAANDDLTFIKGTWDGVRYSMAREYNRASRRGHLAI